MADLADLFNPADLTAAIEAGHVTRKTHPTLPLSIYTYTRTAQYAQAWTPVTTECRGLIVDDKTGEIAAWPFPKFFNVHEHNLGKPYAPPLPEGQPFTVYDKVDGSLIIVFHYAGRWRTASKGSFTSEQAAWAQARLDARDTSALYPDTTYLAEAIYPANRIVVDYGQREDLVLLAAYEANGTEADLAHVSADWLEIGSVVRSWPAMPLAKLLELTAANSLPNGQTSSGLDAEGFVIRFASGRRAKAKLSEYVRLHKILTGITERDIWRTAGLQQWAGQDPKHIAKALGMSANEVTATYSHSAQAGPLDVLLEQVPDEFDAWVRSIVARLNQDWRTLMDAATAEFQLIAHLRGNRGDFARAAQSIQHPAVRSAMFLMLDGKDTSLHMWRAVKPEATMPFVADEEA